MNFTGRALPLRLLNGQAQQVERAFDIDAVGCLGVVFGFGGKDGGQVVDGADFVFDHQPAQQHPVQDIALDEAHAEGFQLIVQGLHIQSDHIDVLLFGQVRDQPVTDFAVRTCDQDNLFTHGCPLF